MTVQPGLESSRASISRELPHPQAGLTHHSSACGKAILVGEHAVLYGCTAIAIPLETIHLQLKGRLLLHGKTHSLIIEQRPLNERVTAILDDALELLALPQHPLEVTGTTSLLVRSGLGASAALSIGVLKLVTGLYQIKEPPPEDLAKMGRLLESRFHGRSSGLDTTTVALEKAIKFQDGKADAIPITPPQNEQAWRFALVDSGMPSATRNMVHKAAPYFTRGQDSRKRKENFEVLAKSTLEALSSGNFVGLATALNKASEALTEIGLMSSRLEAIRNHLLKEGYPASKITGAGGGGCLLTLLCPEKWQEQQKRLQEVFGKKRVLFTALTGSQQVQTSFDLGKSHVSL